MSNYIGISEHRLHHSLGVARKAYQLAKEQGFSEDFARRCFVLGWNHDIGYEFSTTQKGHSKVSASMLQNFDAMLSTSCYLAVAQHGQMPTLLSDEYKILTTADMLVDSRGNEVTVEKRMEDIRNRYGADSWQYKNAINVCTLLNLK